MSMLHHVVTIATSTIVCTTFQSPCIFNVAFNVATSFSHATSTTTIFCTTTICQVVAIAATLT